jgi:maltose O-acetyltransferase
MLARLLPDGVGPRIRAGIYRLFGITVGPATLIFGPIGFGWYGEPFRNLTIGSRCYINRKVFIDATAPVTIGDNVTLGHDVMMITSNHDSSLPEYRAGAVRPGPITIGFGAWIAARVTILPGVTIGDGSVVAAGSVVTKNVPAHTLVAGVPAVPRRALTRSEEREPAIFS